MYCVVEFESEEAVQLIPEKWLSADKTMCKWPKVPPTGLIRKQAVPAEDWENIPVRLRRSNIKTYSEGRKLEERAAVTSTFETTDYDTPRHKRKRRTRSTRDKPNQKLKNPKNTQLIVTPKLELVNPSSDEESSAVASDRIDLSESELDDVPRNIVARSPISNHQNLSGYQNDPTSQACVSGNQLNFSTPSNNRQQFVESINTYNSTVTGSQHNLTLPEGYYSDFRDHQINPGYNPDLYSHPSVASDNSTINQSGAEGHSQYFAPGVKPIHHFSQPGVEQLPPQSYKHTVYTEREPCACCTQCRTRQEAFEKKLLAIVGEIKVDVFELLTKSAAVAESSQNLQIQRIPFQFPLQSDKNLLDLEDWLKKEPSNFDSLVKYCSSFGGKNIGKIVTTILKRLLSSVLAKQINFIGANHKIAFKTLELNAVVLESTRKNYGHSSATEESVQVSIQNWFRNARDLSGGRKNRYEAAQKRKNDII